MVPVSVQVSKPLQCFLDLCAVLWPFWDMINGLILTSVLKAYGQIHTWEIHKQLYMVGFLYSSTSIISWVLSVPWDFPFQSSIQISGTFLAIFCHILPTTMPAGRRAARRWRERTWWSLCHPLGATAPLDKKLPLPWSFIYLYILSVIMISTATLGWPRGWDIRESRGKMIFPFFESFPTPWA